MDELIYHLTDDSFVPAVVNSPGLVLVDFWAPWCGPCRAIAPTLVAIAEQYRGRVKVCKVNVDENQIQAGVYQIAAIPSLLLFKDGEVVSQLVGAVSRAKISEMLDRYI